LTLRSGPLLSVDRARLGVCTRLSFRQWPGAEVFGTAAPQSGYGGTFPGCQMC